MYQFVCTEDPSHKAYSSAKDGTAPCPECAAPMRLVGDAASAARPKSPGIIAARTIWFPGPDYIGREETEGVYAQRIDAVSPDTLIELVQRRAKEDGEWAIEHGHVGNRPEFMRKMMAWVSDSKNILQARAANLDPVVTVDWLCRELAQITKHIGGSRD